VIVHLWEEKRHRLLEHLHGMFAIALWDSSTQTLMLARDRFGVKPLYWAEVAGGIIYGSEPSALLASGMLVARSDPAAIAESLVLQYVMPPRTGFAGMQKLAPGQLLLFCEGRARIERWWRAPRSSRNGAVVTAAEAIDRVDAAVREATTTRLMSEVPLGAFLSGGVDSSIVVSYMAEALSHLQTFSIDFDEPEFSESAYARRVSQLYGTQHHEFVVQPDMVPLVAAAVRHLGEPYADSSAIPTYMLSELTRRHVTVALSGDGGDEAFGGYLRYRLAAGADRWGRAPAVVGRLAGAVMPRAVATRWPRLPRAAESLAIGTRHRYASLMTHFSPSQLEQLLTPQFRAQVPDLWGPWRALESPRLPVPDRYQVVDIETYLPGDLLVKVDRMSMSHALEVRSPFLDHHVHEVAFGLPPASRMRRGTTKWILKELALRRGLPGDLVHRPKQGFGIPVGRWFRRELRSWLEDVLRDPRTRTRGIFDQHAVDRLIDDHVSGRADHTPRLWNLMMLELWHRAYLDG
jgi:asparagine synthase (glutamine-hydrolysing)